MVAVLVAISIPIFTAQLHKAQDATDVANLRSYYALLQADYLENGEPDGWSPKTDLNSVEINGDTITLNNLTYSLDCGSNGYSIVYACSDTSDAGNGHFGSN